MIDAQDALLKVQQRTIDGLERRLGKIETNLANRKELAFQ
jgi:hypothetical protein